MWNVGGEENIYFNSDIMMISLYLSDLKLSKRQLI